jgi:omega-6 fatty acid desaturase (delta-12 desaturase)
MSATNLNISPSEDRSWEKIIKKYNQPVLSKSIWQLLNSYVPYAIMWYLMYLSLQYSYLITLLLAIVASGFLVRIFIIFHDCGHGSFFKSAKANNIFGMLSGIVALTPYRMWHHHHRIHHASAVNLDKRGIGDVWTMTRDEFISAPKNKKLMYRFFRNPFLMFIIGPLFVIFKQNRFTNKRMNKEDKWNMYLTNLAVLAMAIGISMLIGIKAYLIIQLPLIFISHSIGIWLFLIQHNFDDIEWERSDNWDYKTAALKGCSFLKFPAMFQWFTGNIGFHHVHHLSPRIPNYNLARCHYENDIFNVVKPIRFFDTFKFLKLHIWDEEIQKMISFRQLYSRMAVMR